MERLELLKPHLSFILLLSYLTLCAFRPPGLADSFIILGLCGLFGFKLFTDYKPRKDISSQLAEQKLQIYQEMSLMKAELVGRISKENLGLDLNNHKLVKTPTPQVKQTIKF